MRRMEKEVELCTSEIANPFKRVNKDYGIDITCTFSNKEKFASFYDDTDTLDDNSTAEPIGFGVGLSTFSGLRGVDFSDVDTIIFDEFIPERQVRKIKAEGQVFLNMYETVNRNRELLGEPPVKVMLLANSISLASPILLEIGAVPVIAGMIAKGQQRATVKERGLYIELIEQKELAEQKSQTALYKLTKGTDFSKEAIMNRFVDDNLAVAKKVQINEYKPVFNFTEYTCYKHKSREEWYIAKRHDSSPMNYQSTDVDLLKNRFTTLYRVLCLQRKMFFDDYASKLVFDAVLDIK